jgi:hypothetical protein
MGKQDGRGNQQDDPDTDDNRGGPQPEQDQDTQPQEQKQPRMLTNLARYNAPGIKDNENVAGKRKQPDKTPEGRGMRQEEGQDGEIEHATQEKTAKNDGKHKGQNISRTTRINIIKHNNAYVITNNIASIITVNITNHVKRNITITNKKNKQAQRVEENLQEISARM